MTSNTLTDREALYCLLPRSRFRRRNNQRPERHIWDLPVCLEGKAPGTAEIRSPHGAACGGLPGVEKTRIRMAEGVCRPGTEEHPRHRGMRPDYPTRFLPYKDRPAALFVKGSLPENEVPSVAIVGARACTEYGKEAAGFYAGELANAGVNIISGMAAGVDRLCPQRRHRAWKAHLRSLGLRGKRLLPTGKLQNFPCPWRKTAASSRSSSREPAPPP